MKLNNLPGQHSSFSELETMRLKLRYPTAADLLVLRELWHDQKVRQFLGGIILDEMIDDKMIAIQNHWSQYGFGQWSVVDKQHQVMGMCGLHHSEDGIELSYMFFPISWGQGLAKEAALASLDYGFTTLKPDRIIAIAQEANHKSCGLLEKIGMHHVDNFLRFNENQRLYEIMKNE